MSETQNTQVNKMHKKYVVAKINLKAYISNAQTSCYL